MATFADASALAAFTGDDSLDGARGTLLVEQASAAIRTYCSQTFDLVEDDEVVLRGSRSHRLKLPERPVVSVSSVEVQGVPVTAYRLVRDVLFRVGPEDQQFDIGRGSTERSWGDETYTVTVVYTHGFAADHPVMTSLKGVCLQVAARAAGNPQYLTSFDADGVSLGFNDSAGFSLTASEQAQLDRFRHQWATSR